MNKEIMRAAGFGAEVDRFEAGLCAQCSTKVDDLPDETYQKEYATSGLCRTCQDEFFGKGE